MRLHRFVLTLLGSTLACLLPPNIRAQTAAPVPTTAVPSAGLTAPPVLATVLPIVPTDFPPRRGLAPYDSASLRLLAVQRDLMAAQAVLSAIPVASFGGFIEKASASVKQALVDATAGLDYLKTHPALEPPSAWTADDTMRGAEPRPLTPLPMNGGVPPRRGAAPAGVNPSVNNAYQALRTAYFDFMTGPEVEPYQVGDLGGFRNQVRLDIAAAATNLVNAIAFANAPATPPPSPDGELVVNGGFEAPLQQTGYPRPGPILTQGISSGTSAAQFGWHVINGSTFGGFAGQLFGQGYTNSIRGTTLTYGAPAAEGRQWLLLLGSTGHAVEQWTEGNAIEQILPTTPGQKYTLTFAYANNPNPRVDSYTGAEALQPGTCVVMIKDASSEADLIPPASFTQSTATATDYHWTRHEPITFTAKSAHTTLRFQISDFSKRTDGIFLDAISVKPSGSAP